MHAVMASYNEWDGVPNHVNRLLTEILRELGLDGYVVSDGAASTRWSRFTTPQRDPSRRGS